MTIFTIGFTQKSAEQFFEALKQNSIELLVDIRLSNKSQLAGFTKGTDLCYFLDRICGAKYIHCKEFAPSKDLLSRYQKGTTTWGQYEIEFDTIMECRAYYKKFISLFEQFDKICLLCSEPTPEHCHRRLVAEKLQAADPKIDIVHL